MSDINSTCRCPVAQTATILGMPWTALVMRDLLLKGACRYQELLDSLAGIAPNTLSERLKMLESNGIVERQLYEQHPPRAQYVLTAKGRELGQVIRAMRDWGRKHGGTHRPASPKPGRPGARVKIAQQLRPAALPTQRG